MTSDPRPRATDLARIVESARRLNVELDAVEAERWLTAVTTPGAGSDIVLDSEAGVFGHLVSMLDFSPAELARFREIGRLVRIPDRPGVVETALALSGSAAQSKVQSYPGDCDYFERVNILAPTREAACEILADLMRGKALDAMSGPAHQLTEVKYGSYPGPVVRGGRSLPAGAPVSWSAGEVTAGRIEATDAGGQPVTIAWADVAYEPGWCKLDWIVADSTRGQIANASNMLDVTWEAPDGSITPLDGFLDGYFQEVYLDADEMPIFTKLVKHVTADALDTYVAQLEADLRRHLTAPVPNYGKAAKRMYNAFRLMGRYEEAAFLRELFDEPAALLYQVWSVLRTVDEAAEPGSQISLDDVLAQADDLIMDIIRALDDAREIEVVRHILRLEHALCRKEVRHDLDPAVAAARAEVLRIVNQFFHERLVALPAIEDYMTTVQERDRPAASGP